MLPIHHYRSGSEDEGNVHVGILETDTSVGTATINEIILGVLVCQAVGIEPPVGKELVGFGVDRGLMKRVEERWNHHAVRGHSVVVGDWEGPCSFVGDLAKKGQLVDIYGVEQGLLPL